MPYWQELKYKKNPVLLFFFRDELSIYLEDFGMVSTSHEQMGNIFPTNAFEAGILLRCAINNGELTYIVSLLFKSFSILSSYHELEPSLDLYTLFQQFHY